MVRPVASRYPVTLGYRQKMASRPTYIHRGIDYGCPTGTPVVATISGTVVHASYGGGYGSAYGLHVILRTGNVWHLYAHLSAELVSIGQAVTAGQQIGRSGASGNVTGPHLHYQECTQAPGAYTSDRAPRFIDAAGQEANVPTTDTIFDFTWWPQAAARYFGKPWLPRVPGIGVEIRGEASAYGFTELYDNSTALDVLRQLNLDGANFKRAHRDPVAQNGGPAGLEFMYDSDKWSIERPAKAYASGIQNRYAFVTHLTRRATGQHVAFVIGHGPVFYDSLKTKWGAWYAHLLTQVDGPVVSATDFNISGRTKSPRKEVYAVGFRDMRQQTAVVNANLDEFPGRGWLSDIMTIPSEAQIIPPSELDPVDPALDDHRELDARIKIPA